jgi:hypothetical protein
MRLSTRQTQGTRIGGAKKTCPASLMEYGSSGVGWSLQTAETVKYRHHEAVPEYRIWLNMDGLCIVRCVNAFPAKTPFFSQSLSKAYLKCLTFAPDNDRRALIWAR